MKRSKLKGIWKKAITEFEESCASDILGFWYSRYCMDEDVDCDRVLAEARQECPLVSDLELNPYMVTLQTEEGKLHTKYRSGGTIIGHTYFMEPISL